MTTLKDSSHWDAKFRCIAMERVIRRPNLFLYRHTLGKYTRLGQKVAPLPTCKHLLMLGCLQRMQADDSRRQEGSCFDKYPKGLQNGSAGRHVPNHVWLWPHNLWVCQRLITSIGGKWITVILQGTAHHSPLIGMPNPSQSNESGTIQIIIQLSAWLHSPLSMGLNWCGIQNVMKRITSLEKLTGRQECWTQEA